MKPYFFLFGIFLFHTQGEALPHHGKERRALSIRELPRFKKDVRTDLGLSALVFDFPVTYNREVRAWINYYQTRGKKSFQKWLERSTRYAPYIQKELAKHNLPQDLLYVAMIESGFNPIVKSHAGAVGIWQFIKPTAKRYGLKINGWLDERRNFVKATHAAINYQKDLYNMFGSWYLVSASYNSGEGRVKRLIQKYGTKDFWELARRGALPKETMNYVPKIIAATLIAKSPTLYGFKNLQYKVPYQFEQMEVPGGTDLTNLARYLGVKPQYLKDLNPALLRNFIPRRVEKYPIKIPMGSKMLVRQYSKIINQSPI